MNRLKAEAHRMPLFRGGYSEDYFSENALHILRLSHSAASTHIDPFFSAFPRELNPCSWRIPRSMMPT